MHAYVFVSLPLLLEKVTSLLCYTEFDSSCFNKTLIATSGDQSFSCYAYGACALGTLVNNYYGTDCGGRSSCQNKEILEGNGEYAANTRAYLGFAFTDYVNVTDNYFQCWGEASCVGISALLTHTMMCHGVSSCGYNGKSEIYTEIEAYGMYSMTNGYYLASNSSLSSSTINFYLYGYYTGYNSTIECMEGQTCNVYCGTNGCQNMNFICDSTVSTCNTDCDDNTIPCPYFNNDTSGIIPDNETISGIKSIDVDEGYLLEYFMKDYNQYDVNLNKDALQDAIIKECSAACNDNIDSDCYQKTNLAGLLGFISSDKNVSICCNGRNSCSESGINEIENLYCDGYLSCFNSDIHDIGGRIESRSRIGIDNSEVYDFNALLLTGDGSCGTIDSIPYGCNITNGYYVGCYASESCKSSNTIINNVNFIVGTGRESVYSTTINSGNNTNMSVYLLGYESGAQSDINCNYGAVCTIYVWKSAMYYDINSVSCNDCSELFVYALAPSKTLIIKETRDPTSSPSNYPSSDPTSNPSNNRSTTTVATFEPTEDASQVLMSEFSTTGQYVVYLSFGLALFVPLAGSLYYKYGGNSQGDTAKVGLVGKFFFQMGDLFTDLLFNGILYLDKQFRVLFWISINFLGLSYIGSILIGGYWIKQWDTSTENYPQRLHDYLNRHRALLVIFTVFTNFYVSVDFVRSKLFYLDVMYLPLTQKEHEKLNFHRFINIVICENVVQFIIQVVYIWSRGVAEVDSIVFLSCVFSLLSIFGSAFNFYLNICDVCHEKSNINNGKDNGDGGNTKLNCKSAVSGHFIFQSKKFRKYHAFSHNKISECIVAFVNEEIDHQISTINNKNNTNLTKDDISLSCDVYHIDNKLELQDRMTVYFIIEILHPNDRNVELILVNGVYNIICQLLGAPSDPENINARSSITNQSTGGQVSITSANRTMRLKQSRDIRDALGSIHSDLEMVGNVRVDAEAGEADTAVLGLSNKGKSNFFQILAKSLKINNDDGSNENMIAFGGNRQVMKSQIQLLSVDEKNNAKRNSKGISLKPMTRVRSTENKIAEMVEKADGEQVQS